MSAVTIESFVENTTPDYSRWYEQAIPAYSPKGEPQFEDEHGQPIEGIYLDMPNDVYHALEALSSSQLKKFMESPAHYYREYLSDIARKRTTTQKRTLDTGTHGHSLVLEPEGYYQQFFRMPIASDYPDALHTASEIEAELKTRGLKTSGVKEAKAQRLFDADNTLKIFDVIKKEMCAKQGERGEVMHEGEQVETFGGKVPVDGLVWDDAHRIQKTTRQHAEANAYLQHGLPEVAIIARDPITGKLLKVKFDWLRFDDDAVDFKTTASTRPEDFRKQVFNLHYDIQQEFYKYVASLAGIRIRNFVFVATEFIHADICQPFELPMKRILSASRQVQSALTDIKTCMETGHWYGWSALDCTMVLE